MLDSPKAVTKEQIDAFAATISIHRVGLVIHRPEIWAKQTNCFLNTAKKTHLAGGKPITGWMFQSKFAEKLDGQPGYLIAIHHAVWASPAGDMIDVTPFNDNKKHHPLSMDGSVLFLRDEKAIPVVNDKVFAPMATRFWPLSSDQILIKYVEGLAAKEKEICEKLYAGLPLS